MEQLETLNYRQLMAATRSHFKAAQNAAEVVERARMSDYAVIKEHLSKFKAAAEAFKAHFMELSTRSDFEISTMKEEDWQGQMLDLTNRVNVAVDNFNALNVSKRLSKASGQSTAPKIVLDGENETDTHEEAGAVGSNTKIDDPSPNNLSTPLKPDQSQSALNATSFSIRKNVDDIEKDKRRQQLEEYRKALSESTREFELYNKLAAEAKEKQKRILDLLHPQPQHKEGQEEEVEKSSTKEKVEKTEDLLGVAEEMNPAHKQTTDDDEVPSVSKKTQAMPAECTTRDILNLILEIMTSNVLAPQAATQPLSANNVGKRIEVFEKKHIRPPIFPKDPEKFLDFMNSWNLWTAVPENQDPNYQISVLMSTCLKDAPVRIHKILDGLETSRAENIPLIFSRLKAELLNPIEYVMKNYKKLFNLPEPEGEVSKGEKFKHYVRSYRTIRQNLLWQLQLIDESIVDDISMHHAICCIVQQRMLAEKIGSETMVQIYVRMKPPPGKKPVDVLQMFEMLDQEADIFIAAMGNGQRSHRDGQHPRRSGGYT